jgi:hypothetical protein
MLFKISVRTSKRTPHFAVTKIKWLTLFKEIIDVYSEKHTKQINTKCSITDCHSRWFIYLPLGLKRLKYVSHIHDNFVFTSTQILTIKTLETILSKRMCTVHGRFRLHCLRLLKTYVICLQARSGNMTTDFCGI